MLRIVHTVRPWRIVTAVRRSYSAPATSPPSTKATTPSAAAPVPVDEDCIPLRATYSISDYLPSVTPSLSRETLLKLHRLAALEPPSTEQGWAELQELDELVAIVQAVRDVDTSVLGLEKGEMVDARVRAEPEPVDWSSSAGRKSALEDEDAAVGGRELLKLAQRTEGAYYVAPMPENVRTRKRSVGASAAEDENGGVSPDEL
ncbi:hypothetical protein JCM10908_000969 [Rhodotorula pacifica]|uniref:uncharacterized protein n=1 Tax=Rhodotorula pacifica TaxID=1495444 RepID=UPI00316FBB2B